MSKIIGYRFVVEGSSVFPFDMLRYDSCHPADGEAVAALSEGYIGRIPAGRRKATLIAALHGPSVDRWASFGWHVLSQEVIR